jgi:AcrR family transcriptional regulator
MGASDSTRSVGRQQRREELLDAITEVVRVEGPGVSMERLAAGCGVTKPILYRHFDGRDGLVLALAERFVEQLADALLPLMASQAPPAERLRRGIDAYLALLEREHELYRFLSTEAADKRDVLAGMVAEHAALAIESILAERGTDPAPARAWAYGLVGMVHFAGDWWITNRPYDRPVLVEHLTGMLSLGLDITTPTTATPTSNPLTAQEPR